MRKIFFSFIVIAAGNFAAFAQNNSGQNAAQILEQQKAAKQAEEKRLKMEVQELHHYLDEAHQGKRDIKEKYVILHRMLQDYGLLKSTATPEAQAAIREWHELLKSHPEFKTHPPRLEIREQRKAREREEKIEAERKQKLSSWTPKD